MYGGCKKIDTTAHTGVRSAKVRAAKASQKDLEPTVFDRQARLDHQARLASVDSPCLAPRPLSGHEQVTATSSVLLQLPKELQRGTRG